MEDMHSPYCESYGSAHTCEEIDSLEYRAERAEAKIEELRRVSFTPITTGDQQVDQMLRVQAACDANAILSIIGDSDGGSEVSC